MSPHPLSSSDVGAVSGRDDADASPARLSNSTHRCDGVLFRFRPAGQLIPICRACRRREPPLRDGTRATFYVTAPAAQLPSGEWQCDYRIA